MLGAFLAGLATGSTLVLGGVVALRTRLGDRALGLIMAFGAGVLLSAVAYELVLEAESISGGPGIPLGIAAGALTFFAGDTFIERAGGARHRRDVHRGASDSPKAIVFGTVLDGVPESVVIGVTLIAGEGVSVALFVAVFLSNLPEAIAGTSGLVAAGMRRERILAMWALIAVASGISAMVGYGLLGSASGGIVAFVLAFAAGAVLTMLADTMMPEAFQHGGRRAGLATTLGFVVAFTIVYLEEAG